MRKVLFLILIILYGWGASGATIYLHYCCGKLADVDFESVPQKSGCTHSSFKKLPCCSEDVITAGVKDSHLAQSFFASYQAAVAVLPEPNLFRDLRFTAIASVRGVPELYAPPPRDQNLIRQLACTYRI